MLFLVHYAITVIYEDVIFTADKIWRNEFLHRVRKKQSVIYLNKLSNSKDISMADRNWKANLPRIYGTHCKQLFLACVRNNYTFSLPLRNAHNDLARLGTMCTASLQISLDIKLN